MLKNHSTSIAQFSSAYTTQITIGLKEKTDRIAERLSEIITINPDSILFLKPAGDHVFALVGEQDNIPPFIHPIIYDGNAYIDGRAYLTHSGAIRNSYDYTLLTRRALLDLAWVQDNESFSGQESFVVDAFASWLGNGLARNLELGLLPATQFRIVAGIYYLGLFHNRSNASADEVILTLLKQLPRILRVPADVINEIIESNEKLVMDLYLHNNEKIGSPANLLTLVRLFNTLTNDEVHIDISVIYNSTCRGAIVASNAVEIASIAIEHPSTFIAMLMLVNQRTIQRNTSLGQVVAGISKKHDMDSFDRFIKQFN